MKFLITFIPLLKEGAFCNNWVKLLLDQFSPEAREVLGKKSCDLTKGLLKGITDPQEIFQSFEQLKRDNSRKATEEEEDEIWEVTTIEPGYAELREAGSFGSDFAKGMCRGLVEMCGKSKVRIETTLDNDENIRIHKIKWEN